MMRKSCFYIASIVLALVVLLSCKGKGPFLPASTGRPYELLVVADPQIWSQVSGQALKAVLDSNVPNLPQSEDVFKLMHASPALFNTTLKMVRNIIIVNIGKEYPVAKMKSEKNSYASPQRILIIQAPDDESFAKLVTKQAQTIIDYFSHFEINCKLSALKIHYSEQVMSRVKRIFQCSVYIPAELRYIKEGNNFLWASTNTPVANQNFVMYSYPYSGKQTFDINQFVSKRDSVMRINIPGSRGDSYMVTDKTGITSRQLKYDDKSVFEVRGLWRVQNDFMGGPFVSHIYYDKKLHRVYTLEVFVYSPDRKKCNLIRNLEPLLYTLTTNTK